MAIISIKKSQSTNTPPGLANGEIAYSYSSDKLFIGKTTNAGASVSVEVIGGKYLVDKVTTLEGQVSSLQSGGSVETLNDISDVDIVTPSDGEALVYNATTGKWESSVVATESGIALSDLSVGAEGVASGDGSITYNNATGEFNYTPPDLSSFLTSVSYSDITAKPTTLSGYGITDAFSGNYNDLSNKPAIPSNTSDLTNDSGYITGYTVTQGDVTAHQAALSITESQISDFGTYLTSVPAEYATETYVDTAVSNLVDAAPATLDTLNELAAALGDDPSFATTVTNSIASKADTSSLSTVATSGNYNDLSNLPTIPTSLLDLSITDGSSGQVLSTDGAGNFTFQTVSTESPVILGNAIDLGTTAIDGIPGAVTTLATDESVSLAIAKINQAILNLHYDAYIRSVDFTSDITQGGAGTTITLTITPDGTANEFDIDWGDGNQTIATADSTPSHTYATNSGSPFDVTVTARNTNGQGEQSSAELTKASYIIIYTTDPVVDFDLYNAASGGTALTVLEADTGTAIYLDNTTTNIGAGADGTWQVDWGDGTSVDSVASKSAAGGSEGTRLSHTYSTGSGSGTFDLDLTCTDVTTANPTIFPITDTVQLKVFDLGIAAPNDLTTKTISWSSSTTGTSPALANGFTANIPGKSAGDTISSSFPRFTSGTKTTAGMTTLFHTTGAVSQLVNDSSAGSPTADASNVDYYNYDASGSSVSAANRIYSQGLYTTGQMYRVSYDVATGSQGVNKVELSTTEGNTNELYYVYDSMTSNPNVDVSGAVVSHGSGTYNYISGVPYYSSGDTVTVSGISVSNITGQTYYNGSFLTVGDTNVETLSGTSVSDQTYTYSTALNVSNRNGNIPNANLSGAIEDLTVNIGSGDNAVNLNVLARNVNGTNQKVITGTTLNVFNGVDVIDESAISVSSSLGQNYSSDGVRITGFTGTTPSYSSATDYYASNAWTGAETVAGTDEAIIRYGKLKHFDTDLSSGYLPVGPDLNTGRSGTQHFRMAFKRDAVSNFRVRLSGKVSGFFVAAPGTSIDSAASATNGWLDASVQYGGSGVASDGCAFTGADRIISGTVYNNDTFDLTFGTESSTNAYNSQVLISISLNSGDYITALSIEAVA